MKPDEQRAREIAEKVWQQFGAPTIVPHQSGDQEVSEAAAKVMKFMFTDPIERALLEAISDTRKQCAEIVQTKLHNVNSDLADLVAAAIEKGE